VLAWGAATQFTRGSMPKRCMLPKNSMDQGPHLESQLCCWTVGSGFTHALDGALAAQQQAQRNSYRAESQRGCGRQDSVLGQHQLPVPTWRRPGQKVGRRYSSVLDCMHPVDLQVQVTILQALAAHMAEGDTCSQSSALRGMCTVASC
jgi:hypothetical protein